MPIVFLQYIILPIGTFSRRHDLGHPTNECQRCGAIMWQEERSSQGKRNRHNIFYQCCRDGAVTLPLLTNAPPPLVHLLQCDGDNRSIDFKKSIRAYNSLLSFTSIGAKIDYGLLREGGGPYTFRIHGQCHHLIGSLLPEEGQQPKFCQLYIYDTEHESQNRIAIMDRPSSSRGIDGDILRELQAMVDQFNPYAQVFRRVHNLYGSTPPPDLTMRILDTRF